MQIINDVGELSDNIIDSLKTGVGNNNNLGVLNENTKKCHQLQKLSAMLKNSKKGIVNLHTTYSDDANVTARLDEVMDKIDQQYRTILEVLDYMKANGVMTHIIRHEQQRGGGAAAAVAPVPAPTPVVEEHDVSDDEEVDLNF
jgi:hypothetical protein